MITQRDLQEAIAECQGERYPTAKTCIQLAAFYILQDHLFGEPAPHVAQSFSAGPPEESEFLRLIRGVDEEEAWRLVDELVDALSVLNPNLYNTFIDKVKTRSI